VSSGVKVALGCDRRGDTVSRVPLFLLPTIGHEVKDFGYHGASLVDYPDIALPVALAVACDEFGAGILGCRS
jgi:ribose 5-phosphate isomerase B